MKNDITKLSAVDCPALHSYFDIIIFSSKSGRSPWDWKSGGDDYAGDEALLIWTPEIVNNFSDTDCHREDFSSSQDIYFDANTETAAQFSKRLLTLPKSMWDREMQLFSLASLSDESATKRFLDLCVSTHFWDIQSINFPGI